MKIAAVATLVLSAGLPQGRSDGARTPQPAHPRAGMHGLEILSDVVLAAAPDDPHELMVIFAFPDRARWTMRRPAATDRRIEYRFGEHAFALEIGERLPEALADGERGEFLRRCALREAAFLWPDGARWEGAGAECSATVHGLSPPEPSETPRPDPPIGRLVAALGADGLPVRFESRDADGRPEEALEILAWRTEGERRWPGRLRLSLRGEAIWDETVRAVLPHVRHEDRVFVPAAEHVLLRPFARPMRQRLLRATVRAVPLEPDGGWPAALAHAERIRDAAARELPPGRELAPGIALVLAADGRPRAVTLTLAGNPEPTPDGWTVVRQRDAVVVTLGGLDPPSAADLARLAAGIPQERSVERRLVRVGPNELQLLAELE